MVKSKKILEFGNFDKNIHKNPLYMFHWTFFLIVAKRQKKNSPKKTLNVTSVYKHCYKIV